MKKSLLVLSLPLLALSACSDPSLSSGGTGNESTESQSSSEITESTESPSSSEITESTESDLSSETESSSSESSTSESSSSESSSSPEEEGEVLTITPETLQANEAIVLEGVAINSTHPEEFDISAGGSISSSALLGVTKIEADVFGQYDNLVVTDGEGETITGTRVEYEEGVDSVTSYTYTYDFASETDAFRIDNPSEHTVSLYEIRIYFSGEIGELPDPDPTPDPTPGETLTVTEAVEIAATLPEGTSYSEETYRVAGTIESISGNEAILTDGTSDITLYAKDGLPENVYPDYQVTVEGNLQHYYNAKYEIVNFEVIDYVAATYDLTITPSEHGQVSASKSTSIAYGEQITITATPDEGYALQTLTVNGSVVDASGNQATVTVKGDLTIAATFVLEGELKEFETVEYVFSTYEEGVQYAKGEEHVLDSYLTIIITESHLNTQLRIYNSNAHNGFAILDSTNVIHSISFNMATSGDGDATMLNIYGSEDGVTYTADPIAQTEEITSNYADYAVDLSDGGYSNLKLDPSDPGKQVRIQSMTVTYIK